MKLALQPARRNLGAKPAPPHLSVLAHRSRAKLGAVNPFRINPCESVSKQRPLSIFRINTCGNQGGGGCYCELEFTHPYLDRSPSAHQRRYAAFIRTYSAVHSPGHYLS